MNKVIIICLLSISAFGAMTQSYFCECSAFTTETQCKNVVSCAWSNSACAKSCSSVSADQCENLLTCSKNSSTGACESTQACSTYTATTQLECMVKKGNCQASATPTNGVYTCQSYTPATCTSLTVANCKNNYESEDSFCWPSADGTACKAYSMNTCTGLPSEVCPLLGCEYSNGTCAAYKCSSITTAALCTVVRDSYFGSATLCVWSDTTKCTERTSVTDLTESTCTLQTAGGYYWSSSSCTQCVKPTTPSSHSVLLGILAVLLVLIF